MNQAIQSLEIVELWYRDLLVSSDTKHRCLAAESPAGLTI